MRSMALLVVSAMLAVVLATTPKAQVPGAQAAARAQVSAVKHREPLVDVKTSWVEYCFDYYDSHSDVTYYGWHHIRFSNLDGSVVEILD